MANTKSLKPFQPGDKRINRDGRPRNGGDLAALARRIGAEIATTKDGKPVLGPDGKPMTVVEAILRQKAQNPKYQAEFLERGWGKVQTDISMAGKDGERIVIEVVRRENDKDRD